MVIIGQLYRYILNLALHIFTWLISTNTRSAQSARFIWGILIFPFQVLFIKSSV